jgi:hypothetical protein
LVQFVERAKIPRFVLSYRHARHLRPMLSRLPGLAVSRQSPRAPKGCIFSRTRDEFAPLSEEEPKR